MCVCLNMILSRFWTSPLLNWCKSLLTTTYPFGAMFSEKSNRVILKRISIVCNEASLICNVTEYVQPSGKSFWQKKSSVSFFGQKSCNAICNTVNMVYWFLISKEVFAGSRRFVSNVIISIVFESILFRSNLIAFPSATLLNSYEILNSN